MKHITFIFAITLAMSGSAFAQYTDYDRAYRNMMQEQRIYDNWQRDLHTPVVPPYRPPVNCTSSRIGDMVFTNCN